MGKDVSFGYYYITNLQGDVVAILDSNANTVVEYTYDAWGRILTTSGSMATTLGVHNPLRYRGYVYDHESGLYYLQSRYYDPTLGRFINADALVSTGQGLLGYNMFVYCGNNPIVYTDAPGSARYPCTVHINDSGTGVDHGTGFATPDEAAIAFASEWYDNRGGLERGAVIVRFYKNGQPRYQYDAVTKGTRQHVSIDYSNYLGDYTHNGAIMVGDVHTHPKSSVFSKDDVDSYSNMLKQYPDSRFYLAGDDAGVYKYNPNNSNPLRGDYIGSFTPVHGFVTVGSTGSSPTVNNFSLLR